MDNLYCLPKFGPDGQHKYMPQCATGRFRDGYYSHIKGTGYGLYPHSKVFPGTVPLGNPAGINGPIYVSNPDIGPLIEIKPVYDGTSGYQHIHYR